MLIGRKADSYMSGSLAFWKMCIWDRTYTGSSYGYSGRVNVTVTIQGGQIASIEQSNSDSPEYFDYAWETIYPQIMGNQSADGIDAASGATYSSEGILGAIQKALAQALA